MKAYLFFLLVFLGLAGKAQSTDELRNELNQGSLTHLLASYPKEQIITGLFEFTRCCFNPKTDVWYNLAAADLDWLQNAAVHSATSLRMKSYYWIWLLASGKENTPGNYYGVLFLKKTGMKDSSMVADLWVDNKPEYLKEPPYKKIHISYGERNNPYWEEVGRLYREWMVRFKQNGLVSLQKEQLLPLSGSTFNWIITKPYWSK